MIAIILDLDFETFTVGVRLSRIPSIFVPCKQNCYTAKERRILLKNYMNEYEFHKVCLLKKLN